MVGRKERIVIGVNSGTSIDSLDIGLLGIAHSENRYSVRSLNWVSYKFPRDLASLLGELSSGEVIDIHTMLYADKSLASFIGSRIKSALKRSGIKSKSIDLIGSHGQTIAHFPREKLTFQIGDPSIIAVQTGITTVGDFRKADIGGGGEGAPLSPIFHQHIFARAQPIAVLNIGGIANISYIPPIDSSKRPFGFDCGPGNILMDQLCRIHFDRDYDKNGSIAHKGEVLKGPLDRLMLDPFVNDLPPKSTGREYFGERFIKKHLSLRGNPANLLRTALEFSALSIAINIRKFLPSVKKVIVCGGGALNGFLVERISHHLNLKCETSASYGLHPKLVECAGFALFAVMAVDGIHSDLTKTTGSTKPVILGKICYGSRT